MKRLLLVALWAAALPCWAGEHESHGGGLIQGVMEFQILLSETSHAALSADVLNDSPYFVQMVDEFWDNCELHVIQGSRSHIVADPQLGCHLYFSIRQWQEQKKFTDKWMAVCQLVFEATETPNAVRWCSRARRRPIVPSPEYL